MNGNPANLQRLIWATRGRTWGFRFLLDAGLSDPLPVYEAAFGDLSDAPTAWRSQDGQVALRIADPLGRCDSARRVIPHEFVIFGDLATAVDSAEDGLTEVWPLVSEMYASIWESPNPSVG
ncbi:hypothetical protein CH259_04890 [Rhodococcus sp. 05-2254-4]|nr:hypothetical protein CH259_04890 [Rhodococcus sp. 05-2254-4]OZE49566.1 hypothetical protein CH261_03325 [Rhodococcus sp. 05-2254-3]OZE50204.1 hypothetical protein CH283_10630 [Rhodococcus sp. 05-2254-2]